MAYSLLRIHVTCPNIEIARLCFCTSAAPQSAHASAPYEVRDTRMRHGSEQSLFPNTLYLRFQEQWLDMEWSPGRLFLRRGQSTRF
jgi:hypothetical protein